MIELVPVHTGHIVARRREQVFADVFDSIPILFGVVRRVVYAWDFIVNVQLATETREDPQTLFGLSAKRATRGSPELPDCVTPPVVVD